ncbi:MAG: MarR family winged helix-turn-helix transcriptional regulator [Bacillota bacterium]
MILLKSTGASQSREEAAVTVGHDPLTADIEDLLRKVSILIRKRGRDILSNFDITPPQFNALIALNEAGDLTMGELCERMYLACSTATDLIDRMERNGLIDRERDLRDRRVVRLRIKDEGHRVIASVMAARISYLASVLERVPIEERERLAAALLQIYSLMV